MENATHDSLSTGILLIGLGILFLVPGLSFWPWILVVVGLAGLPASLSRRGGWYGWQGFIWLTGLALLFWSGHFWPGILILIGVSMLVGAVSRESEGSPLGRREPSSDDPFGLDSSSDEPE